MKNYAIAGVALLLAATSCQKKETLSSGISLKNMDTLVKPGDDFGKFVNGNWIKNTQIPADKASYGAFDMLVDQSQKDVKSIIEEAAKGNNVQGSDEQKIGDYYASFIDRKTRDSKGIEPIKPELAKIDAITNYNELASYFGRANRLGLNVPFSISVYTDFLDPTKYTAITWQGGLGLPDRDYYLSTDAKMAELRAKYVAHVEAMLTLAGMENPAEKAKTIMNLETTLASSHMKKEDTRDIVKLNNPYPVENLKTLMPDFDWSAMLTQSGFDKEKKVVVTQVDYTKSLNNIIKNTPIDTWKTFLKWGVIKNAATSLTTEIDKQNFEFYGKAMSGTEKQQEDWKRAVNRVNEGLGEIVGKVYVKKHFSPEAKERMTVLVNNLLKAYAESIKKLDWMSDATKKEALKKVDKFMVKIGYPDKWRDYSKLTIDKSDLYGNTARATEFEYQRNLDKLGKPVDRSEWGLTPQTVNAYYNPSLNEIVFPAAILQPPFFNMNADDAVNYGGIGAVIGHEIGHGFDDQGSTFDGEGVMKNWWTPADLEAFKAKTNALVEQYNEFKVFPDLNVNGAFTLGENIGDLGGLSIAIKAYKMSLNGKEAPVMDGYTGIQRVFLGWGQVWAEKTRDEALRTQVATDPHSPAQFRVNGVVRNVPEFYEAFDIKPTDKLYLAPEKRVKIW
ncbi:M13 family metallopeptidase [Flavobacterium capsici]|uniref:M13-type metalloendopeptidase n=1 Tax=Flavobacterium capsici TaxID=3075618 RepID=A0AA96EXA8_9FLAO|nr:MULTISPECIES: M13-type metalloendopeptidase [unclassified Flavobacterium]WNM19777.1 M13-type metalloendopeptidase [Flavobacterium sp. PMR2A8]WNM21166.1 M13-type metalloendopeptidase [Flavobacterium sp. PMTSA4]